jgi:uncharacterized protein YbjT (DUF2867 family)
MTAFVLGATGFVGREVVRQLCVRGAKVIAHVRPDSRALDDWRLRFGGLGAEVDDSPWQVDALAARLRTLAVAQLYILIGTTRSRARTDAVDGDIYQAVDFGLTRLAVDAAVAGGTRPRVIYLSSIGADDKARSAYLAARGRAEQAVITSGLPWVIARPSFITGDRDDRRVGERVAAVASDGLLAVARAFGASKLRDTYRSTSPDILASALIRLGEAAEHDQIFDGAALR